MNIVYALSAVVALTTVPLFLDLLRSFAVLRRGSLGRAVARATSASLVCAVAAICGIGLKLFFVHVLPFHQPEKGSASWLMLAICGIYLCFGTIASHAAAVIVAPGRAAPATAVGAAAAERPPHAHFCSICRYTVLDSDHHCIFTGNCVGRYNRRSFYVFLLHLMAAASFAVCLAWQPFRLCVINVLLGPRSIARDPACVGVGAAQLALVPALMVWLPIALLFGWHALLLRADQSTAHFVHRSNSDGICAAMRELFCRRKSLCKNRAWQLACSNYAAADELAAAARGAAEVPERRRL